MIPNTLYYPDELNSLYDVIGYAIWGLLDSSNQTKNLAYSFLDELFADDNCPYISGEPGWSIVRVDLSNFESKYSHDPFVGNSLNSLLALKSAGEKEAYWVDDSNSSQRETVVDSRTFWLAVRNSLIAFGQQHPDKQNEVDEGVRRYYKFFSKEE